MSETKKVPDLRLFVVDGVRFYAQINPDGYELLGRPATEYRPIDVIALKQLRAAKRSTTSSMQIPTDDGSVTEEEAANFTNEANEHLKKFEVVVGPDCPYPITPEFLEVLRRAAQSAKESDSEKSSI